MNIRFILILIFVVVGVIGVGFLVQHVMTMSDTIEGEQRVNDAGGGGSRAFSRDGLATNTDKRSIELGQILDGGPGKDGIPAIDNPKFISVTEAARELRPESVGMLVSVGDDVRFYPYSIMNWHEIVNDTIGGKPLVVTFCPLCGSAIVFDATVSGEVLTFGVSGKLYESNLLMYDRKTESLWSQSRGEAVVGDMLGTELTIYPTQVLTFEQVHRQFPDARILSRDTGYSRAYDFDPYSGYDQSDTTFFPISVRDERFGAKELFYIVPVGDSSVALKLRDLTAGVTARVRVGNDELVATATDGILDARLNGQGTPLPNYVEMWFSWAIHHQEDGIIWQAGN